MKRILGIAAAALLGAAAAAADPAVLCQKTVGAWACGPCAIYNALQFGAAPLPALGAALPGATPEARATGILAKYGALPSGPFQGRRPRFLPGKGMPPEDMASSFADVLHDLGAPGAPARGSYLDVRTGETGGQQMARVRGMIVRSLAAGLPPILELNSYAAEASDKGADGFSWKYLDGHFVAVVGVGELPDGAPGFVLKLADSYTGKIVQAFAFAEVHRPFGAPKGHVVQDDGGDKPTWLKGYPYLQAVVPDIPLAIQKAPWHQRTTVVLRYLAYRE
jgi:hypothetical protein